MFTTMTVRCQKAPREIATKWVAAKSVAEGPLTNLAAVAADDAWGASRPRHWLAERAPANYTYAKELRHTAGSGAGRCRIPIKEGRTATAFDSRRAGTQSIASSVDLMVGRARAGACSQLRSPFFKDACWENGRHVGRNNTSVPSINHKQIACHRATNVKMTGSPGLSGDEGQEPQRGM